MFPIAAEKLAALMSVEDVNALEAEAQEIQARLDAQASGNAAVQTDFKLALATVKAQGEKLAALETTMADQLKALETLGGQVAEVSKENARLKAWEDATHQATTTTTAADAAGVETKPKNLTETQEALLKAVAAAAFK